MGLLHETATAPYFMCKRLPFDMRIDILPVLAADRTAGDGVLRAAVDAR